MPVISVEKLIDEFEMDGKKLENLLNKLIQIKTELSLFLEDDECKLIFINIDDIQKMISNLLKELNKSTLKDKLEIIRNYFSKSKLTEVYSIFMENFADYNYKLDLLILSNKKIKEKVNSSLISIKNDMLIINNIFYTYEIHFNNKLENSNHNKEILESIRTNIKNLKDKVARNSVEAEIINDNVLKDLLDFLKHDKTIDPEKIGLFQKKYKVEIEEKKEKSIGMILLFKKCLMVCKKSNKDKNSFGIQMFLNGLIVKDKEDEQVKDNKKVPLNRLELAYQFIKSKQKVSTIIFEKSETKLKFKEKVESLQEKISLNHFFDISNKELNMSCNCQERHLLNSVHKCIFHGCSVVRHLSCIGKFDNICNSRKSKVDRDNLYKTFKFIDDESLS
jgi:hypothetical protein